MTNIADLCNWPWTVCVVCSTIYAVRGASHSRFKSWISCQVSMRNLGLLPICVVFLQASRNPTTIKKNVRVAATNHPSDLGILLCSDNKTAVSSTLTWMQQSDCCQQKKSNTTSCIISTCIFVKKSKASWNTLRRLWRLCYFFYLPFSPLYPECRSIGGQSRYRRFPAHQSTNTLKPKIKSQGFSKYCWPGAKCGCGSGPQKAALPF